MLYTILKITFLSTFVCQNSVRFSPSALFIRCTYTGISLCLLSVTVSLCFLEQMYVQDVLREQLSEKALEVLHKNVGHLYVCGGMSMARDVAATLQNILANKTGMTITEAGEYLERLKVSRCFNPHVLV